MAATTMPLWATAQAAIVSALKEVSIRDAAVSPALAFSASKNLYLPHILSLTQKAIVNVRINSIAASSQTAVYGHKQNNVTFFCDCYCLGSNTEDGAGDIIPADENAVARLHYLVAQVESALTDAKNHKLGLLQSQIHRNISTETTFYDPENTEQSVYTYVPARVSLQATIVQEVLDSQDAPTLENIGITPEQIENWSILYTY